MTRKVTWIIIHPSPSMYYAHIRWTFHYILQALYAFKPSHSITDDLLKVKKLVHVISFLRYIYIHTYVHGLKYWITIFKPQYIMFIQSQYHIHTRVNWFLFLTQNLVNYFVRFTIYTHILTFCFIFLWLYYYWYQLSF